MKSRRMLVGFVSAEAAVEIEKRIRTKGIKSLCAKWRSMPDNALFRYYLSERQTYLCRWNKMNK